VSGEATPWRTEIADVRPGSIRVRGYDLLELIGGRPFGDVVFLLLAGELPEGNQGRMLDAILVAAAEHSVHAPSVDAARFVASAGVPLQAAVAAGVAGLGDHHGGAVDAGAAMLLEAERDGARIVVERTRDAGRRLPGYGHAIHDPDPRAARLFEVAAELGLDGRYVALAREVEAAAGEVLGRALPLNIDGAMAALLLELGLDPAIGKAFYVIARAPGFCAHVFEQQTRDRPYRDVGWRNVEYTGPEPRPLP
jgi:citrate synthase